MTPIKLFLSVLSALAVLACAVSASAAGIPPSEEYTEVSLIATAYYSPLPDQSVYLRGSYEADVRLNGAGIHGASGKDVFPGMLAAPKSYAFGTKILIQGLGIGSVEDRGGAIVPAGVRGHPYDRIDIWMGSGEQGLRRALAWGKRTVSARIYASKTIDAAIPFGGIDAKLGAEMKVALASLTKKASKAAATSEEDELALKVAEFQKEEARFRDYLDTGKPPEIGDASPAIRHVQSVLASLGYFDRPTTGIYGQYTADALARFQGDQGLVSGKEDPNAGKLGPLTRDKLVNEAMFQGVDIAG